MRHRKKTVKLNRTSSHRKALFANMVSSLIREEAIITTVAKARAAQPIAEKMVTLAKKNTLAARRLSSGRLMLSYNPLTSKDKRQVKKGYISCYNVDRQVLSKLFGDLREKFATRNGGYTRIIRKGFQVGDNAEKCYIEFVE